MQLIFHSLLFSHSLLFKRYSRAITTRLQVKIALGGILMEDEIDWGGDLDDDWSFTLLFASATKAAPA